MKVGLFVDLSNLYYCVAKKFNGKVDYAKYLNIAIGTHSLYRAYAYGAQLGNEARYFLDRLEELGYEPRYKEPKQFKNLDSQIDLSPLELIINHPSLTSTKEELDKALQTLNQLKTYLGKKREFRKADWDVGLAIDVVRTIDRLDAVVLGTADGDLAPLVQWTKDQGCKCIIYACNVAKELRDIADLVIEINRDVLETKGT